jgi:hypothetical protein
MAIGTGAAILGASALGAGASLLSGSKQADASEKAAESSERAAMAGIQTQRDFAQQARIDAYPWMLGGAQAYYKLMDEMGVSRPVNPILPDLSQGPLGTGGTSTQSNALTSSSATAGTSTGTASGVTPVSDIAFTSGTGFRETPGYQFQVSEGEKGIINNLGALGLRGSGAALKELTKYRMGVADQTYGNYLNRLSSLAGVGQTTTQNTNNLMSGYASNISSGQQAAGNAQASGYLGTANAWSNALSGATNSLGWGAGTLAKSGTNSLLSGTNYLSSGTSDPTRIGSLY